MRKSLTAVAAGAALAMLAAPTNALGPAKEGRLRVLATLLPQRSPAVRDSGLPLE